MKTSSVTMSRSSSHQDFTSNSKRHFHWTKKVGSEEDDEAEAGKPNAAASTDHHQCHDRGFNNAADKKKMDHTKEANAVPSSSSPIPKRKLQAIAVSRLRSVLTAFRNRSGSTLGLGPRVVGTLFGHRKGHVHFALQKDPASQPALLIELATPISGLVREMTSGLVRIALECNKPEPQKRSPSSSSSSSSHHIPRLLEEPVWRTYCNGRRCGFAARRECGPKEWKVLKAVEMISMGAGVLPATGDDNGLDPESSGSINLDGEVMYMRAKFERIVGSRDCEAFYMMNPDSNGAPELSIYLLRV
ncbi:protein MIZU-KUSSEI 1 [Punica granatum]|uniref:Uncharacterized protein n=2 Tax=Punica granatum TaxID=22663 RepID=A0A218XZ44_PUNGR|nr:protein MIZU-KUSSEI 1 [Punica granatum]OWM90327.1 hypothetical protein CDL15_Pgr014629 [Punica granatum]PKI70362.1 hypothetical protein CRG98_009242 [Punica granatum]